MRIDILCTDPDHPVVAQLRDWQMRHSDHHQVQLLHDKSQLSTGDILFLISCSQLIGPDARQPYGHVLVLHASDLPIGRGWSPHIWDILAGRDHITLSMLYAEDGVDTGDILAKQKIPIARDALYDEINAALFSAEVEMMDTAIDLISQGVPATRQEDTQASYHPRRTPADSQIDPADSIKDVFNQLRVADPTRFPAFFELYGHVYDIQITKREAKADEN